jgi:hypothetical protein
VGVEGSNPFCSTKSRLQFKELAQRSIGPRQIMAISNLIPRHYLALDDRDVMQIWVRTLG